MLINLTEMTSGFCDRLRLITFVVAVTKYKFKKVKTIKIVEFKSKECPYLFSTCCEVEKFKIKRVKKLNKDEISFKMNPYNSDLTEKNIEKILLTKNLNIKNFLSKWKRAYKLLKPKRKIKIKIDNLKLPKNYLGLHVRATDKLVSLYTKLTEIPSKSTIIKSQLNYFLRNIDQIIKKQTDCKNIYLACDDQNLKLNILKILKSNGFRIYLNNSKFYGRRFRQTNAEDFVIDLFCLANSTKIISSTGGGVPITSSFMSKKKLKIYNHLDSFNIFYILNLLSRFIYFFRKIFK